MPLSLATRDGKRKPTPSGVGSDQDWFTSPPGTVPSPQQRARNLLFPLRQQECGCPIQAKLGWDLADGASAFICHPERRRPCRRSRRTPIPV